MPAGEQDLGSLWNFTFRSDERPKGEERGESWVRFVIFTFRAGGTPGTGTLGRYGLQFGSIIFRHFMSFSPLLQDSGDRIVS